MKQMLIASVLLTQIPPLFCCPTCIGLPRPHERPFFERKSFLAALQQPVAQKQQEKVPKESSDKQSQEKS